LDRKGDTIKGYTIFDKSGYVFNERELSQNILMENRLHTFGNGDKYTEVDTYSKQFRLEIQKLIKEAFYTSYLKSPKRDGLLSENILSRGSMDVLSGIISSKNLLP